MNLAKSQSANTLFVLESFGFKYGDPKGANFIFDVRCLPNPYWQDDLRFLSGIDYKVTQYFQGISEVNDLILDISDYLVKWLPKFSQKNRKSVKIAIGCTGGFHRSVYVAQSVLLKLEPKIRGLSLHHRDLAKNGL